MQVIAAHVHADTRAAVSQECARELVEQHADTSVAPWEGDAWRLQEMVAAVRCVTARPRLTNTHTFRLHVGLGVVSLTMSVVAARARLAPLPNAQSVS